MLTYLFSYLDRAPAGTILSKVASLEYHRYLPSANLCYTTLYYTILCYTILYSILYYTMLYYTILYYTYYTILYYTILYYTILHYTTLHYTILHYIVLYIYCEIKGYIMPVRSHWYKTKLSNFFTLRQKTVCNPLW